MFHFKIYPIVSIRYNKLHLEPGVNHWPMSMLPFIWKLLVFANKWHLVCKSLSCVCKHSCYHLYENTICMHMPAHRVTGMWLFEIDRDSLQTLAVFCKHLLSVCKQLPCVACQFFANKRVCLQINAPVGQQLFANKCECLQTHALGCKSCVHTKKNALPTLLHYAITTFSYPGHAPLLNQLTTPSSQLLHHDYSALFDHDSDSMCYYDDTPKYRFCCFCNTCKCSSCIFPCMSTGKCHVHQPTTDLWMPSSGQSSPFDANSWKRPRGRAVFGRLLSPHYPNFVVNIPWP